MSDKPALRPLDFQPVIYQGQRMWYLRDPLQLTEYQIIMPQLMAQIVTLLDGSRTVAEVHADFCQMIGEAVDYGIVEDALNQLDQAVLLDNERFFRAQQERLQAYRAQSHRPPALADLSYPARPDALTRLLQDYGRSDNLNGWQPWQGRGIISPHIDYPRGGTVYAQVWRRAEAAIREADLVLIFGTDHNGGYGTVTLTQLPYATPYGILPTDTAVIDQIAAAIGPEHAYKEELHHIQEHSVELSAVWLHHKTQQMGIAPKPMVPILCGSFHQFVTTDTHPAADTRLNAALAALKQATAGKRVLVVASVDLAHVGPAFGDTSPMDTTRREKLQASDAALMQAIEAGDAARFYQLIAATEDRNRICGFSSIYLMLRYLEETKGQSIAYQQCPADDENSSFVSICGMLLT